VTEARAHLLHCGPEFLPVCSSAEPSPVRRAIKSIRNVGIDLCSERLKRREHLRRRLGDTPAVYDVPGMSRSGNR
jgi:hypothetical protein